MSLIVLPDEELQEQVDERVFDIISAQMDALEERYERQASGFWYSWKPADRLRRYEQAGPPLIDGADLEAWIVAYLAGEATVVDLIIPYDSTTAFVPQTPEEAAFVLAPESGYLPMPNGTFMKKSMWRQMLEHEPKELVRLLRDYASILKAQQKREEKKLAQIIPGTFPDDSLTIPLPEVDNLGGSQPEMTI